MANIISSIQSAWQRNQAAFQWPPTNVAAGSMFSDYDRLRNYVRFQNIYWGLYSKAFPLEEAFTASINGQANLAARAVDALHAAIWVETPEVDSADEQMKLFAHKVLASNSMEDSITDNIRDTILLGDGVLKVAVVNNKIQFINVHPGNYFPEIRQPFTQTPIAHNLIYEEEVDSEIMVRERYWLNEETGTWWLTTTRFSKTSGKEFAPINNDDLKCKGCPIIHTFSKRVSGIFWGKAPMLDAEQATSEYAATQIKLGRITAMASTRALLAAPQGAFDDRGVFVWNTNRPLMVDDADAATFDISKYGFVDVPGAELIEPNQEMLDRNEKDVFAAFGLTTIINAETGNMRDVGEPGLARANLLMEFTINQYQKKYGVFLSDAINVAREFARNWLGMDTVPETDTEVMFKWTNFAPESELEKAQTAQAKMVTGLPKRKALEEQGYKNADVLVAEQNAELQGQLIVPHSPYDPEHPDPAIDDAIDEILP